MPDATRTSASDAQETDQLYEQKGAIRRKDGVNLAATDKHCMRSREYATYTRYPDTALLYIVWHTDKEAKAIMLLTSMAPVKQGLVAARETEVLFIPYRKNAKVKSQQHAHSTTTTRSQNQTATLPMALVETLPAWRNQRLTRAVR